MTFAQKLRDTYRAYARKRADLKLVREMQRALPEMMRDMDRMVADLARADHSIVSIMEEAKKRDHVITLPAREAAPAVPPFDADACTILQNPMNVPRQPIRVRQRVS